MRIFLSFTLVLACLVLQSAVCYADRGGRTCFDSEGDLKAYLWKHPQKELLLSDCIKLTNLPSLSNSVKRLWIRNCPALTTLSGLPDSLNELRLEKCYSLSCLPGVPPSLAALHVVDCPALTALPLLPSSLKEIEIGNPSVVANLAEGGGAVCESVWTAEHSSNRR